MSETILLVDDDRAFCDALAMALQRRGFTVVVAHGFADAMREAAAWKPHRAVVDLHMPGRSGLELITELTRVLPDLAVVVLTGYGSIATAVEAIKAGATHYVSKPAHVDEILSAFDRTAPEVALPAVEQTKPLEEVEWEHLQRVLTECDGNISEAARRLGMHRRSLQRKLARGRPGAD